MDICANRIALLRRLNPSTPLFGLYGGAEPQNPRALDLDDDYALPFTDARFKWEHGDLCLRRWYQDRGAALPFDMLHIVEWDLIMTKPIDALFSHVTDGIALTDLKTLAAYRQEGWGWITNREDQFTQLAAFIQKRHGVMLDREKLLAGPFCGASASRAFCERYAAEEPPLLLHDEIRLSAYATAFGMEIRDTGLRAKAALWNCEKNYYTAEQVYEATSRSCVMHPVIEKLDLNRLLP